MAKGQKRGNREIKKPKQDKASAPKPESPFRTQVGHSALDVKRVNGKPRS